MLWKIVSLKTKVDNYLPLSYFLNIYMNWNCAKIHPWHLIKLWFCRWSAHATHLCTAHKVISFVVKIGLKQQRQLDVVNNTTLDFILSSFLLFTFDLNSFLTLTCSKLFVLNSVNIENVFFFFFLQLIQDNAITFQKVF